MIWIVDHSPKLWLLVFYRVHLIAPGCAGIKTALLFIPPARMGREHKPRSHLDTVPPGRLSATIGVYPHPCLGQDYIKYTRSVDSATLAICVLLFNSAGVIIISSRGMHFRFNFVKISSPYRKENISNGLFSPSALRPYELIWLIISRICSSENWPKSFPFGIILRIIS